MMAIINSGLVKVGVEAVLFAMFFLFLFSFIVRLTSAVAYKRPYKLYEIWLMAIFIGAWYFIYNL